MSQPHKIKRSQPLDEPITPVANVVMRPVQEVSLNPTSWLVHERNSSSNDSSFKLIYIIYFILMLFRPWLRKGIGLILLLLLFILYYMYVKG